MSQRQSQSQSHARSEGIQRRSAAELDRDARAEAGNLNGILSTQPPWSREAEQSRQRCRDIHLLLIFSHPLSPYSQSLDNLWHQTSYLLISAYRNIISNIERSSSSSQPQQGRRDRRSDNNFNSHELRKAITRFKQFLSSEESFYKSLISRIYNYHELQDLPGIASSLLQVKIPLGNQFDDDGHDEVEVGRGQEKKDKLSLIYKGLICLGDLERYKEQYNNGNANQKPNRRGGPEERFGEARKYYEVARCIQPDDGAAFNQLAVISTYTSDSFSTIYYYFRASAIRNAFKGIHGILYEYLGKATERWRVRRKEDKEEPSLESGNEVKKWKEDMIVLVGILYLKAGFSFIPTLQPVLFDQMGSLLRSRQLSTENIVKTIIILIGLHHHARNTAGIEQDAKLIQRSHEGEFRSLELLLGISQIIMKIACEEIEEVKSTIINQSALSVENDNDDDNEQEGQSDDLTVYISAILRRILPSLRIISKWIKMDLVYLCRQNQAHPSSTILKEFWITYKKLIDDLMEVFPISQLPSLPEPLEEDLDMKGFLPLQRGITSENNESNSLESQGDVHPNEEQLMRLADIQVDAKLIMQSAVGSALLGNPRPFALPVQVNSREESDIAYVSTDTEDDPVNLAMRATLASESSIDGDEEKELDNEKVILWNKSPPPGTPPGIPLPPTALVPAPAASSTKKPTAYDLLQNLMLESTPTPPAADSHLPPTTASPSLGIHSSPQAHTITSTTSGSGAFLFGSGGNAPGQGGNSIWAMTREESEKGQKRSSTGVSVGVGQPNIAAIWSTPNPSPGPTATGSTEHTPPATSTYHSQHIQQAQIYNYPPQEGSASQPRGVQQQYYTHNQPQYPYQPTQVPQSQTQHNRTWGLSNVPLPLPLPSSQQPQSDPTSASYPYDQTPSQNQHQNQSQQVPYYLQPAYYNAKPWGTSGGQG
ncbi:hypothetical protein L486_02462 [Kwoniella mangroviensis CBS 10435]|uniref:Protein SMG7 n=1 Tax=Kwoniella mangroviensis CBS 10435 TaxID=1331196 RepID=A0A1B9IW76_9TREE|nr:hypothetical protein L486_02462 [Kwoniella mangroviensis CBS 10435]